jgi:hypothetical protein
MPTSQQSQWSKSGLDFCKFFQIEDETSKQLFSNLNQLETDKDGRYLSFNIFFQITSVVRPLYNVFSINALLKLAKCFIPQPPANLGFAKLS